MSTKNENKLRELNMKTRTLSFALALLVAAASSAIAQETVFFSGFEGMEDAVIFEPDEMNGADNQVGEWTGLEFPEGQGDILFSGDAIGILPSPYGGSLILLDRPMGDLDDDRADPETGDITGSFFADLTESISLLGSEVAFQVGTRRTGGNEDKSYSIIGRGSDGSESFHVRVSANNNGGERLGYVSGGETVFDLPTVVGEDSANDLDNTGGGFTAEAGTGPGLGAEIANVLLRLGSDGFIIDFSYPEENTSGFANAYVSQQLPYNGDAMDLAQLEFTYEASTANGRNSGYFLDEVSVTTLGDITIGDFDSDGDVGFSDFLILRDNLGTGTNFTEGDINFDGQVNLKDFIELKALFAGGGAGEAAAVPEPSAHLLLSVAGMACLFFRRRR